MGYSPPPPRQGQKTTFPTDSGPFTLGGLLRSVRGERYKLIWKKPKSGIGPPRTLPCCVSINSSRSTTSYVLRSVVRLTPKLSRGTCSGGWLLA